MNFPGSVAVIVNVVSDIIPADTLSKNTSVPTGTPVTFITASNSGSIVLYVGLNVFLAVTVSSTIQ